ncbi:hypothetical protein LCGC14_1991340 [marine sediment metagenome]|uniref:Recombination endonuclease VII n=1 Tax=marine sediment metagenome TaxID=412755 RepID=A0A0F9I347_9ZZZZ
MSLAKRTSKTKTCIKCGETKPRSQFNKCKARPDGLGYWCRPCASAYSKRWYKSEDRRAQNAAYREAHPEQIKETMRKHAAKAIAADPLWYRRKNLQRLYGITLEDYERMLKEQGGGCAICGVAPKKLSHAVDHNHKTGKVRGILCHMCNRGLAFFRDKPERLTEAAAYLLK